MIRNDRQISRHESASGQVCESNPRDESLTKERTSFAPKGPDRCDGKSTVGPAARARRIYDPALRQTESHHAGLAREAFNNIDSGTNRGRALPSRSRRQTRPQATADPALRSNRLPVCQSGEGQRNHAYFRLEASASRGAAAGVVTGD